VAARRRVEFDLRLLRAYLNSGDLDAATRLLERLRHDHPDDWRVAWFQGVADLTGHRLPKAHQAFDRVYAMLHAQVPRPDLVIYLQARPDVLLDRVKNQTLAAQAHQRYHGRLRRTG